MNMLLNLKMANQAAADSAPTDRKTLVCIFLNGGMDSVSYTHLTLPTIYSV